jgi:hypothetical protein
MLAPERSNTHRQPTIHICLPVDEDEAAVPQFLGAFTLARPGAAKSSGWNARRHRTTPCSSRAGLATVLAPRAGKGARQRGAVTALAVALQGHVPTLGPQLKADVLKKKTTWGKNNRFGS